MKKFSLFCGAILLLSACSSTDPLDLDKDPVEIETNVDDFENSDDKDQDNKGNHEIEKARIRLSEEERTAMASINEFSYDLVCSYAKEYQQSGNFSVSLVSVSVFLSMLANATDGEAQQEIFNLLNTNNLEAINSLSQKLMEYLPTETTGASLSINNRFWVADKYCVPEAFSTTVKKFYNADVVPVNFLNPATVPAINQWVSLTTNGLIPGILYENWETYKEASSIAANTVYFRALWASKFDETLTKKEPFSTPGGKKITDMMHKTLKTEYASNEHFQLVRLPYKSETNELELYLPNHDCSPEEMAALLTPDMQRSLYSKINDYYVTLTMPKFETRSGQKSLNQILANLGADKLFSAVYRPMGITDPSSHQFTHETAIKVDEEGTELAAATADLVVTSNGNAVPHEPQSVTVTFDRPFIYLVRNSDTKAILMAGVITNP
ncbi:MAG: hypothetical protein K2K84_02235 [Muribaculaceae bacterium]|nr:hypothetical protein [Muribaculaceae bacterium]